MKIAITGSHGTGKTTLAKILTDKLEFKLIPETAREILEEWQVEPWKLESGEARVFQEEVIERQIKYEIKNTNNDFISDRTVFDGLAYAKHQGLANYEHLSKMAIIHNQQYPYDYVIRLPICFPLEGKGRSTDLEYQKEIDYLIIQETEKHQIDFVTITDPDLDQRIEKLFKKITLWKTQNY